jgi:predicted transposase YbfD/YdcC
MGPMPDPQVFVDMFAGLPDPRTHRTRVHSLEAILFLCLCAVICGANDPVSVERFGKARKDFLEKFVDLSAGIPSHDTIGRVLAKLNPDALEAMFARWMAAVAKATDDEVIAIDGKTLRRAVDKARGGAFVHMVSAWSTANGVVLGQVATSEHSNEITAIPRLLALLQLKNCLVTIDAIGCQTEIVDAIVDGGGDYLISVKDNQPKLNAAIIDKFDEALAKRRWTKRDHAKTEDSAHGRTEVRRCWVLPVDESFSERARWKGLAKLVYVERETTIGGTTSVGTRLFITSRASLNAEDALAAVRGHWQVENKVHWTLDVAFREDDSRLRAENAAENLAVVRHVALNLLRSVKGSNVGIKNRRLEAGWSEEFLMKVLAAHAN